MGLIVINPGLSTTVQDLGRPGYREFGVPEGGAFDRGSLRLANALLGNSPDSAAIELTMVGGVYQATRPLALAIAGAPFVATVHGEGRADVLLVPQTFSMAVGDRLVFTGLDRCLRAYLAVRGGWRTPKVLGGRSTEDRLRAGDVLPAEPRSVAVRRPVAGEFGGALSGPIRLIDGPDGPVPAGLIEQEFRVSPASDRVGLRLEGPPLDGVEMPGRDSAPVAPGAVQISGGRAMILGVAGGTMGGYPHRAHVISADLDRLAQLRPFESVRFKRVEPAEARRLDRERRERLDVRDRVFAAGSREGDG